VAQNTALSGLGLVGVSTVVHMPMITVASVMPVGVMVTMIVPVPVFVVPVPMVIISRLLWKARKASEGTVELCGTAQ
jgi:hypothetical protein